MPLDEVSYINNMYYIYDANNVVKLEADEFTDDEDDEDFDFNGNKTSRRHK